jgi:hypothetical protein
MEGLPSGHWHPYLTQHLHSLGSAKCSQRLSTKILKTITNLVHSQWKHPNTYVHEEGRPFEQTALALLDSQILEEYSLGHYSLHLLINTTSPIAYSLSALLALLLGVELRVVATS